MPLFVPDIVRWDDPIGFGQWLTGHYYEHRQFVQIGLLSTPVHVIHDFDLLAWKEGDDKSRRFWLDMHQVVHRELREITGVQGFDLSIVDFDKPASFTTWLDSHATEHVLLRQAFGVH